MTPFRSLTVIFFALALVFGACGDDDGDDSATPAGDDSSAPSGEVVSDPAIDITDYEFLPAELTVAPGAEIPVSNNDTDAHTLTAKGDGGFDTDTLEGEASGSITAPSEAGTYEYVCAFHPFMTGSVTVSG